MTSQTKGRKETIDQLSQRYRNAICDCIEKPSHQKLTKDDSYIISYPWLRSFWIDKPSVTTGDLIQAAHMIYGWMPTVLTLDAGNNGKKLEAARKAADRMFHQHEIPERAILYSDLQDMKSALNNSVVGSSKVLHFMRPDLYPIWNSVVHRAVDGRQNGANHVNRCTAYFEAMHNAAKSHGELAERKMRELMMNSEIADDYQVTRIRAMEMLLFLKYRKRPG